MKLKKNQILLVTIGLIFYFAACDLLQDDKKQEGLSPEQAKVEIRSANQRLQAENDALMNAPGMVSLDYLADLTSNQSWKSSLEYALFEAGDISYHNVKDIFTSQNNTRSDEDDYLGNPGTYKFNFELDRFELIEPSTTTLIMIYPADEQAYAEQKLNAELVADNLQFTPISYTTTEWDEYSQTWITETEYDTVLTNTNVSLKIDEATVLTGHYHSTLASNGSPTSVDVSLAMMPYEFMMGFSGSGVNYNTTLSMKLSGEEIMGYNLALTYSADMEDVMRVEGSYRMPPVKFEGFMNYHAIETHIEEADATQNYDIPYLNDQIDMVIYQTELDAQIGIIVFMLYTDPDDGDQSPQLAVQYSDGTWEWLETILDEGGSKRSGQPWRWCFD